MKPKTITLAELDKRVSNLVAEGLDYIAQGYAPYYAAEKVVRGKVDKCDEESAAQLLCALLLRRIALALPGNKRAELAGALPACNPLWN